MFRFNRIAQRLATRNYASSSKGKTIVVIPGDFVGAEVTPWGVACIKAVADATPSLGPVSFVTKEAGGGAIDKYGTTLPDDTFEACKNADAIFFGSVGGPKWTGASTDNPMLRPEWWVYSQHVIPLALKNQSY